MFSFPILVKKDNIWFVFRRALLHSLTNECFLKSSYLYLLFGISSGPTFPGNWSPQYQIFSIAHLCPDLQQLVSQTCFRELCCGYFLKPIQFHSQSRTAWSWNRKRTWSVPNVWSCCLLTTELVNRIGIIWYHFNGISSAMEFLSYASRDHNR